ncbi:uncharacterized protein LOC124650229 isoform X2 [Lolium rigidum]|uniref:uncharacterized protein LOC124650229 isoform X2 n=1 Tax=Lolium rigidum TaxID=89674 RepID=UPI001F5CB073|nr:uncharacterized protein LOC124650229 isoform X2 [Lolium rigidum]
MDGSDSVSCGAMYTTSSGAFDDGRPLLQCACRVPAARFTSTKQSSGGKNFFKCRASSCFTWIWGERLMEFVNALVRRSTATIEGEMRIAKSEWEWRIQLVENKLEVARRELSEAIGERNGLNAVASRTHLQGRDFAGVFSQIGIFILLVPNA